MIKKYTYGKPFQTESVVVDIAAEKGQPDHGNIDLTAGFSYTFGLEDSDIVYGLGEANRGINKRGYKYISNNADNPHHHEDVYSLYHGGIIPGHEDEPYLRRALQGRSIYQYRLRSHQPDRARLHGGLSWMQGILP